MPFQPPTSSVQSPSVAVVVPAAGQGTRLGGTRKQDRMLGDAPLVVQTLRVFARHPAIGQIVVAVPPGEGAPAQQRLAGYGLPDIAIVEGGATRRASVAKALGALAGPVEIVLVHDAVRPFVDAALVQAVVDEARRSGAAVPAIPVADTLRQADGGVFGETIPRDGLFLVQTPQGFRRDWLEHAYAPDVRLPDAVTDDAALVQHAGYAVHLVTGSARNFKITTPDDWALARLLWPLSPLL